MLRGYELAGKLSVDKFIPIDYLFSSVPNRLKLLQGLMDTDGDIGRGNRGHTATFNTSSLQLRNDFMFLVNSLGGVGKWSSRIPKYKYKGEIKEGQRAYRISFKLPSGLVPVSSRKHLCVWKPQVKYGPTRGIESIDYVGMQPTRCISVANPNSLYITDDFIVTHNTTVSLQSLYLDGLLEEPGIVCGPLASAAAWCGEGSDPTEHYGLDIFPLSGRKDPDISLLAEHKHFFIHYDILQPWVIPFTGIDPRWVIFDESHYLMYQKANRSEAAYNLSLWATIERRICLTGTPIPNRRLDLWHQLAVAQPRQWGGKRNWGERFCGGRRQAEADGGHWTYEGETNCIELRQRLCGTFLRYTRYDIADELPELSRRIEREEAPDEALTEYRRAASDVIRYLKDTGKLKVGKTKVQFGSQEVTVSAADNKPGAIHLRGLSVLIGLLSEYKAEWGANEAYRMLDYHDRIVVFTYRRASAKLIADRLKEKAEQLNGGPSFEVFGPIDGTIKQKDRQAAAKRFAKKPVAFYVATIGAAGISINELSVASGVLFVDLHWNPAVLTQAESRIHRDGSIHKKVESTFLVVKNTVDELFVEKLTEKAQAASGVSPDDEIGTHLVADLTATGSKDDPANLDEICAMLAQRKDLN
jgi:hypothetical protein